ncbi:MAG: glucokinase, partial [Gammaproteobacteria bacterium]|nr:glucokinase [Gammaproteobacteria bacterium]
KRPEICALGVAAPITGDSVSMINIDWQFSINEVSQQLGLKALHVVNDFTALAYALPHLEEKDRVQIGSGQPKRGAVLAVLGPGTGFGMSALIPIDDGWEAIAGEGGHSTMPASTEEEWQIISASIQRFGHCSVERILSGPGLLDLFEILSEQIGQRRRPSTPSEVTELARSGHTVAMKAMMCFFSMVGTVAGNLALTLGALGGVYIGGGIIPSEQELFARSGFRAKFEDKGRYRDYMSRIPTYLITAENPTLLGLKAVIEAHE